MWKTVKYILFGIAWGCTWLVAMSVFLWFWNDAAFTGMMEEYPQQALGAAAVGVASTLPARLYSVRKLPHLWCFAIHIGAALSVFFPVSFALGWIPYNPGNASAMMLEILIGVGVFLAIWSVFFLINRSEARRINERVRQIRRDGGPAGNK